MSRVKERDRVLDHIANSGFEYESKTKEEAEFIFSKYDRLLDDSEKYWQDHQGNINWDMLMSWVVEPFGKNNRRFWKRKFLLYYLEWKFEQDNLNDKGELFNDDNR